MEKKKRTRHLLYLNQTISNTFAWIRLGWVLDGTPGTMISCSAATRLYSPFGCCSRKRALNGHPRRASSRNACVEVSIQAASEGSACKGENWPKHHQRRRPTPHRTQPPPRHSSQPPVRRPAGTHQERITEITEPVVYKDEFPVLRRWHGVRSPKFQAIVRQVIQQRTKCTGAINKRRLLEGVG